jgi:cyclase
MLRPRIIPCLLVHKKGLVKTTQFANSKYVGDPINAVKIFNEKEVDELIVLDIDASSEKRGPDFNLIKNLACECRMPLCYGGGISSVEEAVKIINLGAEKLAISTSAIKNFELLEEIGKVVGMQSVVVVIDVRKNGKGLYDVYIRNGKEKVDINFEEYLKRLSSINVGEIVINSIDNDGMMKGYDIELVKLVRNLTEMPITILGGAGTYTHLKEMISMFKIIGVAAGSLFVFKGIFRAVLINYPKKDEKSSILEGV